MEKNSDDLQDILARMDRLEAGLGVQIDRFVKTEQILSKAGKDLMLEVEQLKTVKHSLRQNLPEMLNKSLEKQAQHMIPKLIPPLTKMFRESTDEFIDSSLEKAQKLKEGIDHAIYKADGFISSRKREITLRGLGLSVIFCFSSLLTAGAIFYYFPQKVSYGITSSTAGTLVFGEAFTENIDKLSLEQREFFVKKAKDKLQLKKRFK
jgi:hypothetical protein